MLRFTKKKVIIALSAVVLLAGAGGAFAYWSAGGSGTGSGATGTNVSITAVQTLDVEDMAPGDSAQSLHGTFLNTNSGPVYVTSVTASIDSVEQDVAAVGDCDASDYTLADAVMTIDAEALADDTSTWDGATIKFNNKVGVNQDGCKLATVHLAYVIA